MMICGSILLPLAVLIAVCIGGSLALLRWTPERWNSLDIKIGGFRLQASDSTDE
jgi:hypothetical protein